jgi:flagellar protein FlbT
MSKSMQVWLKAGERIYINGAVVRVDRKVALELLNDVVFLREAHVLQADETTTPLRQLYFVVQTILMCPDEVETTRSLFRDLFVSTLESFSNEAVRGELREVAELVGSDRVFEAMKVIRGLFPIEEAILSGGKPQEPSRAA